MMLNTRDDRNCDKCNSKLNEQKYTPKKTQRGCEVLVCDKCGLAQTFYTEVYSSRPPGNMSCNADRSSIRYTKTLIARDYQKVIDIATSNFSSKSNISVLDIGSNRGSFLHFFTKKFVNANFLCIEPDADVVDYTPVNGSVIIDRVENTQLPKSFFDLVYCVHTLEHVVSATSTLRKLYECLKNNGSLILGVPKLELYDDVIEELFIDPHTFHFRHIDIIDYALKVGFSVRYLSPRNHNDVIAVLEKTQTGGRKFYKPDYISEPFHITKYEKLLAANRKKFDKMAAKVSEISKSRPILIWGAGRIFDCLYKQPSWKPSNIKVYDKYIRDILPIINNKKLLSEEELTKLPKNTLILVASRDYFSEIQKEALGLGFSDIRTFGDYTNG